MDETAAPAERYPFHLMASWFHAGSPKLADDVIEAHREAVARACDGYIRRYYFRGQETGVGRDEIRATLTSMATAAKRLSEGMTIIINEGQRRGQADTDRGHAARALWQYLRESFFADLLAHAPLSDEQMRAVIARQAGGITPAEDGLSYRGRSVGLPVGLLLWSKRLDDLASGRFGEKVFADLAPVPRSPDAAKAHWLQEMACIWTSATNKRATSNKPKDTQPETWRSPFHQFAGAAWTHMGWLVSGDFGDLGHPDSVRNLLSPKMAAVGDEA